MIIELDARFGGIFLDGVPEGCEAFDWCEHDAYLRCGMDALAPGAHRMLMLPITIPPRAGTNQLTVHAFLETRYGDLRRDNDHARKRLTIVPSAGPSRR